MGKNEMITIQMSKEEAKEIRNTIITAAEMAEGLSETMDDLYDLLTPVMAFAVDEDSFLAKLQKEKGLNDPCEKCVFPSDKKPNKEKPDDVQEESEEEVLAIELLKAVFSALTDLIENGE